MDYQNEMSLLLEFRGRHDNPPTWTPGDWVVPHPSAPCTTQGRPALVVLVDMLAPPLFLVGNASGMRPQVKIAHLASDDETVVCSWVEAHWLTPYAPPTRVGRTEAYPH